MFNSVTEAIEMLDSDEASEDERVEACEYLIDNRDKLTERVFIALSNELHSNTDPKWDRVKANSAERCSCGNERVIIPTGIRTEYIPSPTSHVLGNGNILSFKPIGGKKESTYVRIKVREGIMAFTLDPYAPFILSMDMFSGQGYSLEDLARARLNKPNEPLTIFFRSKDGFAAPVFEITSVDVASGTIIVVPDMAIEAFEN